MRKRIKGEGGAIVIEATISLTAFMFLIVTILSITNICIIQARMTNALNATAKEIAQYSYLYSLTGFDESINGLNNAGESDTEKLKESFGDLGSFYTNMQGIGKNVSGVLSDPKELTGEQLDEAWNSIQGNAENAAAAVQAFGESFGEVMDDPKKVIFGIGKLAAAYGFNELKDSLAQMLVKGLIKKHLVPEKGSNVESYLRGLGVVPDSTSGKYFDGLNFDECTLIPIIKKEGDGDDADSPSAYSIEIVVSVSYDVKLITMLPVDLTMRFTQSAKTHGWTKNGGS